VPDVHRRPRILFYTHDSYGIGHVRRTLTIAGEIAQRRPDVSMVLVTGALDVEGLHLPKQLDYVKLPAVAHRELYGALPGSDATARSAPEFFALREKLIREVVTSFSPDVMVVELVPAGLQQELRSTLTEIRAKAPATRLVLGLRDILNDPELTRRAWTRARIYDVLEAVYDLILIYGSREVFDPIVEYGFSPAVAAKTVFCGYLTRDGSVISRPEIRARVGAGDESLVVVTTGGGAHGGPLLSAYLEAVAQGRLPGVASFLTLGPLLPAAERREVERRAMRLSSTVVVPFATELPSYLAAADVVITMGGYNTLAETLRLGRRAVVVPRVHPEPEQRVRAERFAALGLVGLVRPEELTPARLADAVRASLAGPPPIVSLDFGGLGRAVDTLTGLLT
jgi:predicted glycosyltransferase